MTALDTVEITVEPWTWPFAQTRRADIDQHLDLFGSVGREPFEETGLDIVSCQVEPGWTLVRDGGFLALMKRVTVNENAELLRMKIIQHLANEAQPEFTNIRIVRRLADLDLATPRFYVEYLRAELS